MDQSTEGSMSTARKQEDRPANPWVEYERRKNELPESLSADQREAELRKIADELGI